MRAGPSKGRSLSVPANPKRDPPPILPTGTVTFLFTDIQGSTPLWEGDAESMQRSFARHEAIVREAMADHGGYVYKMVGDAFQVAFSTASAALSAALAAQRALQAEPWGPSGALKVRMALHTGVTEERGNDYVGPDLNRIARLLNAAHGGQVLLSQATADLVRDHLPQGVSLRDLGEHTLKDLSRPERICQVVAPGLPDDFGSLGTVDTRPRNLPSPSTPFVGREPELAHIKALLQDPQCRLISLVGLGGSGKTRLAIQAAEQCVDAQDLQVFPQGVYFVSLVEVSTLGGIVGAIADALQMPFYVQPSSNLSLEAAKAQLLGYVADKEALLVLDNVEHLLAELPVAGQLAVLIADLLATAPGLKLIATSRERLNVPGEWALEVTGLPFPGSDSREDTPQYAAVQLFVGCAVRVGAFVVEAADWPAVGRICQLLGGMPLGVEMAAAWTKVLSCQEIAIELERDLLALIATWRTVPERHRTLRTVFDHSWRLLSTKERDVLDRLSIFRSGFRREAAAEVADASISLLGALIDKSLLRRTPDGRFELHPVLRQCAAEKLTADPCAHAEARSRHAHYYSEWLILMNEKLKGSEQLAALVALRTETQNLHDAWQWLIEQRDLKRLHAVLPAIILFHEMHGRLVGAQRVVQLLHSMRRALDHVPGGGTAAVDDSLLALVLAALRHFDPDFEHPEGTNLYQQHSLKIAETLPDSQEKAFILLLNSIWPGFLTPQQSMDLCQQCIGIFQCLGDAWGTALTQVVLADVANHSGVDAELARTHYQLGMEGFVRLGSDWGRALCLTGLADVERRAGHLEEAYRMGSQSLGTNLRMGDTWRVVTMRHTLGEIAEELGRIDEARCHLEANLAYFSRMGDGPGQDYCRERLQRLDERTRAADSQVRQEETSTPVPPPVLPSRPPADDLVEPLSAREIEVLCLLAEGLTNREIAQQLYLSPNTVRVHTFHIYGKLGVHNRTQAVAKARSLGMLTSS